MNFTSRTIRFTSLSAFLLGAFGCELRPVSAALDESPLPYVVSTTSNGHRLATRIPVPAGMLESGTSVYQGTQYTPSESPPGEATGNWVRQNTWYYPYGWSDRDEFWFGWMLLDLFSIDRAHHVSPLPLESQGVSVLFSTFQNDRFTAYYPPEVSNSLNNALNGTGADSVFGIFFRAWPRDTLVAAQIDPGSAAWNAGLRSDDRLLRFDGRWASQSLTYLRDTAGHRSVEIQFLHPATGATTSVSVLRSQHLMPSLFVDTLPGAVGYIAIGQFVSTDQIATDILFQTAATWLESNSKGAWILDLRGNGGGTINAAQNIVSALVGTGANLMHLRERTLVDATMEGMEIVDTLRANNVARRLAGRSIYLLQDRHSASASEIVISALRENLGSSVVTLGDTSYGKGIGQIYEQTPLGGYMAVTCLHIDPMNHPSYHQIGIAPDQRLVSNDSIIARSWDLARAKSSARTLGILPGMPDFSVLEWNRREFPKKIREPMFPATLRHPFEIR